MAETMVGLFATSKAGHDKDEVYVIVSEECEYVFLCDGRLKKISNPKKKKKKHIQIISHQTDEKLQSKLVNKEAVLDEEIKFAIKGYKKASQGALG